MKFNKTISIIIPNNNGVELLKKHLSKVIEYSLGCEIIVVDDASTDDSVEYIKNNHPNVTVLCRQTPHGFSYAVNEGVKAAKGEIIVLINSDVSPERNWLRTIPNWFEDPDMFAVGMLEKSHESKGVVLRGRGVACWKRGFFIHERGEVDSNQTAWVSGGSGAFRRELIIKLGGFDTLYAPFYWEDIDLSYRAMKAGYKIGFEPNSIVNHFHDKGAIRTQYSNSHIMHIAYRNQWLFVWINATDIMPSHVVWALYHIITSLLTGNSGLVIGFIAAMILIPHVMIRRKARQVLWKRNDNEIVLR